MKPDQRTIEHRRGYSVALSEYGLYAKQNLDYTENGNTDEVLKFVLSRKLDIVNLKLAELTFFRMKQFDYLIGELL